MTTLGADPEPGFLHLDEVADMGILLQHGTRAQTGEGANRALIRHQGALDDGVGFHLAVIPNLAILQHGAGPDAHMVAEFDLALDDDVDVDHHFLPDLEGAAQIEAGRIDQGDPGDHQLLGLHLLIAALEGRQLDPVVGPFHLHGAVRMDGGDGAAIPMGHGDHVGEIELPLGVLVVQTGQPATQLGAIGHQHTGIHLADGELFGVGILLLDDADYLAVFTDDTAIAGGVVQHHCQQRHAVVGLGGQQPLQGLGLDQRGVAVEHQHVILILPERDRLGDGMAGAQLLRLQHPVEIRGGDPLLEQLGAVAIDQVQLFGTYLASGVDHMGHHGFVGDRVQHLGQNGTHASTFTRSQDHDVERHSQPLKHEEMLGGVYPTGKKKATRRSLFASP
ncbi:hypothetical protein D3C78_327460 [compost metagenome]